MQCKRGVLSKKINGKYIVLKPGDSHIYEFNETAGYLWNLLNKHQKKEVLITKLCQKYVVNRDKAATDVNNFISKYCKEGLIEDCP